MAIKPSGPQNQAMILAVKTPFKIWKLSILFLLLIAQSSITSNTLGIQLGVIIRIAWIEKKLEFYQLMNTLDEW